MAKLTVPVEYTRGGQTHVIDVPAGTTPDVPVDWDAVVALLLRVVTIAVVGGAMAWSTVAIGTLLHRMAPAWVSYLVAVVFDLSWAACMGAEYLMRYDRKRVWIPRLAGFLALAVSVLVIMLEGDTVTGSLAIGAAGSVISVLAKGLWTVCMMISTRKLSDMDRLWYEQASSAAGAEEAVVAIQRRLARSQARVRNERLALGLDPESVPALASAPVPDPAPATVPDPAPVSVPASAPVSVPQSGSGPIRSGSVPQIPSVPAVAQSGSGSTVLDRVWIRIRSGMDPVREKDAIVAAIVADDPTVNPETVRRMVRTARNALASQQPVQLPANP